MDPTCDSRLWHPIGFGRKRKRRRPTSFVGALTGMFVATSLGGLRPVTKAFYSTRRLQRFHPEAKIVSENTRTSIWVSIVDDGGSPMDDSRNPVCDGSSGQVQDAFREIQRLKADLKAELNCGKVDKGVENIKRMLDVCSISLSSRRIVDRHELSSMVDSAFLEVYRVSFSPPFNNIHRIYTGIDAMYLQLSSAVLENPFNTLLRRTLSDALSALAAIQLDRYELDYSRSSSHEAFRILQRLISNVGIRGKSSQPLSEKEFAQVLRTHCQGGLMETAERIVSLQERTPRGPPLSPVIYSILLKGYGRKGCLENVKNVLQRTLHSDIVCDVIYMNTLLDAFVNCNALDEASKIFLEMKSGTLSPNRRTYNTYMKGLARQGNLTQAIVLADEIKQLRLWDSITTNTLVHAAVVAGNFSFAESVLSKETMRTTKYEDNHPNVQAYTELVDMYCKLDQVDRALGTLKAMQLRGVEPNEVTYACLLGGLGRNNCVDLARKITGYLKARGHRVTSKMYNALILGILNETNASDLDHRVDEVITMLREMISENINPNAMTVSIIVDSLGRCLSPRVNEAQLLVNELEQLRCIPLGDNRVFTSLIRSYGKIGDIQGVLTSFHKVQSPDTFTVNAYMDACCRCDSEKLAIDAFERFFRHGNNILHPDVVSYAVLIGSFSKRNSAESTRRIHLLYRDMKSRRNIHPDNGLVDVILKGMIRLEPSQRLNKEHMVLVMDVLKDAEQLVWEDGQLDRRKRAIRAVMTDKTEDELFRRKGWNRVDSGFRMWGFDDSNSKKVNQSDKFLKKHGWNDVDSSFRLF
jgi:pentatricopeptide repeat protein